MIKLLMDPAEAAVLTSTPSTVFVEGADATVHVFRTAAIKPADTMRMDPTIDGPRFDELPIDQPD